MRHFCQFVQTLGFADGQINVCDSLSESFFIYSHPDYALGSDAKRRVFDYVSQQPLFLQDYGQLDQADFVLGFSFGDSDTINHDLAQLAKIVHQNKPQLALYLQQEIALHASCLPNVPIANTAYQTTLDVAKQAHQQQGGHKVVVLAQAWHAKRCIETCNALGLEVVALRVAHGFPANDPQPWVRNPINWVIKESHRHLATGYEISQRYQLA
ncbi:hypothetical protein VII00023_07829 [Vibrio ichthyoenteri ATCC 700023]|uniref:DUF218 domain-containing protein n=1 Tax=Vibrio ichthyoenteri ATCC 700023 TaxID=870968 RepID=F9S761_9VIBR|nr:hypothetical protein [Vibrio ichthyoenteri]EGU31948.1 hypothetical protein VII00023_07829 [Vibrio ichthyoenteri ATCC 700023]